jgi:hypothetical protein
MIGAGVSYEDWALALSYGDPRVLRRALRAMLRSAGDLAPLQADAEADRLMTEAPVRDLHRLVERAVRHALDKVETALGNSPAASAPAEAATGEASTT